MAQDLATEMEKVIYVKVSAVSDNHKITCPTGLETNISVNCTNEKPDYCGIAGLDGESAAED